MAKFQEPVGDSRFNLQLAIGHKNRTGHDLDAVTASDDGIIWRMVRLCCGETA